MPRKYRTEMPTIFEFAFCDALCFSFVRYFTAGYNSSRPVASGIEKLAWNGLGIARESVEISLI